MNKLIDYINYKKILYNIYYIIKKYFIEKLFWFFLSSSQNHFTIIY